MHAVSEEPEAITRARDGVRTKLAQSGVDQSALPPNLEMASLFVRSIHECIDGLNEVAGASPEIATLITGSVLQASFPVFLHARHGRLERASDILYQTWIDYALTFGLVSEGGPRLIPPSDPIEPTPDMGELLMLFNLAVGKCLRRDSGGAEARRVLRRLSTSLDLSFDELGQMLGVRGETVRRWERGLAPVPTARLADLTNAEAALDRLLGFFRPERLPIAIRRPAELFGGESALRWILRGQIRDVANRYDRILAYQQ